MMLEPDWQFANYICNGLIGLVVGPYYHEEWVDYIMMEAKVDWDLKDIPVAAVKK